MSKLIETEDGYFRMRRGKLVRIPDEWVGEIVYAQTIRKRPSKKIRKLRMNKIGNGKPVKKHPNTWAPRTKHHATW